MTKKYRVVFHGLISKREDFTASMESLGVTKEIVDRMIKKAPVILKCDLTLKSARQYADTMQDAGGRVTIQENGRFDEPRRFNRPISIASFRDFTMCPECGFKQPKAEFCCKCGFRLGKAQKERENGDV